MVLSIASGPSRMNRENWRTDALGMFCIGVVFYCLIAGRYQGVVMAALLVALFCAIYPRIKLSVTRVVDDKK